MGVTSTSNRDLFYTYVPIVTEFPTLHPIATSIAETHPPNEPAIHENQLGRALAQFTLQYSTIVLARWVRLILLRAKPIELRLIPNFGNSLLPGRITSLRCANIDPPSNFNCGGA